MERDFFGLSTKNGAATIKDAAADKLKDPAAVVRGAGIQWSFSYKVSALPQLLSFKATQEDRPMKTILHPLASTGYMTMSTADAFIPDQKPFLSVVQKKVITGKQAGNRYGMTVYPLQSFDGNSAIPQEPRLFSVSNQSNQVSLVLQSNRASTTQNMVNAAIKPQSLGVGGVSHVAPMSLPSSGGSIVGSTDLRNSSTGQRAQLTIFYDGSVCVYDDISPEKAKAVMLLAGNRSTPIWNKTVSTDKLQPPISMPSKDGGLITSQSYPLSVTSLTNFQLGGVSCSNNEIGIVKPVGSLATPSNHLESPNIGSVGSTTTKMVPPVGLPQARKASLARFLEKRKERVKTTSPYYMTKKLLECSTSGSDGVGFSISSPGSCPQLFIS